MGLLGILIILVCAVLIFIVLVQNSKGGGLASNFSSNNQILGVAKTKDILEQITWGAAALLFVFCLLSTPPKTSGSGDGDKNGKGDKNKKEAVTNVVSETQPFAKAGPTSIPNPIKSTPPAVKR